MLKKSKGNRFHRQGFIFSTFPINFIICLTPYRKASITGAFFIKESEDIMGVRVVFPDMGKDPSVQLIEKTITENGTYDAITDGANGYSKVNVNVEGGAGGGESDFSTAQVTNSGDSEENITLMCVINEIGPNIETPTEGSVRAGGTKTAVLYKGHQYVTFDPAKIITVSSGNAEIITVADPMFGNMNFLDIKGDCTILVTNAE